MSNHNRMIILDDDNGDSDDKDDGDDGDNDGAGDDDLMMTMIRRW